MWRAVGAIVCSVAHELRHVASAADTGLLRNHICMGPPAHMFANTPTGLGVSGSMNVQNPWTRGHGFFLRPCSPLFHYQLQSERFPMNSIIYIVGLVVVVVAVLSFFGLR